MNKNIVTFLIGLFCFSLVLGSSSASAQSMPGKTRILFLFDASQSMYSKWQTKSKFDVARNLLINITDSLSKLHHVEMAMRVYGHMKRFPPQDCDDSRLEVPFSLNAAPEIKKKLFEINPSGTTPIARSLMECESDFPSDPSRNIIILITDGIEECDGDPCAASLLLQRKGIVLKPFVIGLGLGKEYIKSFECVGNFYDADNENKFEQVMGVVISQALNNTTAQVNLLDIYARPTETNVNMTFYDSHTGQVKYNLIHTLNSKGLPDTLFLDPLPTYNITVHTIPPAILDSVRLTPGKHSTIGINTPQGSIEIKTESMNEYKRIDCIVRKAGDMKTLNVQSMNSSEKYLTGSYDIEILTLPRIYLKDVNVAQSKTTTLQVPKPGIATFLSKSPGYGSIYVYNNNKLQLVYNLSAELTKETLVLQPGRYLMVYRPKASTAALYTIEKEFRIVSGTSISVSAK
ncbi:MAG TPA: VWA domain-containing protein [Bacteroidia bacterium]|nr:VWA domain-containing protein [Bacteroidia bacterium]